MAELTEADFQHDHAVMIDLSASGLQVEFSLNMVLHTLSALGFTEKQMSVQKRTVYWDAKSVMKTLNLAATESQDVEFYHEVLKIAIPIELGRTKGVQRTNASEKDNKTLKAVLNDKKPIASFKELYANYIVPVYFVPPEIIVADKREPGRIPTGMSAPVRVSGNVQEHRAPGLDKNAVKCFLINLALNRQDARKAWLERTILNPKKAQDYLNYLDARIKELQEFYTRPAAIDKELAALTKEEETTLAAYKAMVAANVMGDKRQHAKQKVKDLRTQRDELLAAKAAADEAKKRFAQTRSERPILEHMLFFADLAVAIDPKTRKQRSKKEPSAVENHNDLSGDESGGDTNEPERKTLTPTSSLDDTITLDDLELLRPKFIWQLQAHMAKAAQSMTEASNASPGYDKADVTIFSHYKNLRSSTIYTDGKENSKATNYVFPDADTLNFAGRRKLNDTYFELKCHGVSVAFPFFSIRTLLTNYVWYVQKRRMLLVQRVMNKTKKDKSSLFGANDDDLSVSDAPMGNDADLSVSQEAVVVVAKKPAKQAAVPPPIDQVADVEMNDLSDSDSEETRQIKARLAAKKKAKTSQKSAVTKKASTIDPLDLSQSSELQSDSDSERKSAAKRKRSEDKAPVLSPKKAKKEALVPVVAQLKAAATPLMSSEKKTKKRDDESKKGTKRKMETPPPPETNDVVVEQAKKKKSKTLPLETAPAAPVPTGPVFNLEETEHFLLNTFAKDGEWDTTSLVHADDVASLQNVEEVRKSLLATVHSNNFHDKMILVAMLPTNSEIEQLHSAITFAAPLALDTLVKVLYLVSNLPHLPLNLSNFLLSYKAVIESECENAAQDYLTSASGHAEMADLTATMVNACDLSLRTFASLNIRHNIPPFIEGTA